MDVSCCLSGLVLNSLLVVVILFLFFFFFNDRAGKGFQPVFL